MNLNEKIINIRCELQKINLKKSGKNKFANFSYFELSDFLPTLNELMSKYKVNDQITFKNGNLTLILHSEDTLQEYALPFTIYETPINNKGVKMMQDIQYLGALNTYYKRYLYLNAFGITDGEVIDSMDNSQQAPLSKKDELYAYIKQNNLNNNDIAIQFNLSRTSTEKDFENVLNKLKGGN